MLNKLYIIVKFFSAGRTESTVSRKAAYLDKHSGGNSVRVLRRGCRRCNIHLPSIETREDEEAACDRNSACGGCDAMDQEGNRGEAEIGERAERGGTVDAGSKDRETKVHRCH